MARRLRAISGSPEPDASEAVQVVANHNEVLALPAAAERNTVILAEFAHTAEEVSKGDKE